MFLFLGKVISSTVCAARLALLPLVRNSDVMTIAPLILVAAAVIAIIAGTVGMRRFLDV